MPSSTDRFRTFSAKNKPTTKASMDAVVTRMRKSAAIIGVDTNDSALLYAVINGLKPWIQAQVTQRRPADLNQALHWRPPVLRKLRRHNQTRRRQINLPPCEKKYKNSQRTSAKWTLPLWIEVVHWHLLDVKRSRRQRSPSTSSWEPSPTTTLRFGQSRINVGRRLQHPARQTQQIACTRCGYSRHQQLSSYGTYMLLLYET